LRTREVSKARQHRLEAQVEALQNENRSLRAKVEGHLARSAEQKTQTTAKHQARELAETRANKCGPLARGTRA